MTVLLGPSLELQLAVVPLLTGSADMKTLLGNPVRINPAQTATWPGSYITIGEGHVVPDLAECIDGSEVYFDIHIWSRQDKSFADAKRISATLWSVLKDATIALTENLCIEIDRESEVFLRDPDGETLHIALTFRALMEPAA
jgi:hypothetical protein